MKRLICGLSEDLQKIFALIDDEDHIRCLEYNWRLHANNLNNGSMDPGSKFYVMSDYYDDLGVHRFLRLHRFIMRVTNPLWQVHHIDNDPLNNQKDNLAIMKSQREHSQEHLGRKW